MSIEHSYDDTVLDGMLLTGAAIGGFAAAVCVDDCSAEDRTAVGVIYGLIGMGIGALVDAVQHRSETVYRSDTRRVDSELQFGPLDGDGGITLATRWRW